MFGVLNLADEARHDVDACLHRKFLGFDLIAHCGNRIYRRTDEFNAFLGQRLGKAGPFGQEAIARMNRLGPGLLAGVDDLFGDQIAFRRRRRPDMHCLIRHPHKWRARIGIGIDRHGGNPHPARSLDDPASDFAAIGDQDFLEHQVSVST